MRARIARRLRTIADRIDREHAPRRTHLSFTYKPTIPGRQGGAFVNADGIGCPLWYLSEDDYERAHTEAPRAPSTGRVS